MKDSAVQEKISESRKNALAADRDRNRKIDEKRRRTKLAKYGNPTWNNRVKSEKNFQAKPWWLAVDERNDCQNEKYARA